MASTELWSARREAERAWHQRAWHQRAAPERDTGLRPEVARSWHRSARHVAPDRKQAPMVAEDRAGERWRESPLSAAVAALGDELPRIVTSGGFIAAVTDEHGTILFTHGSHWMRDRAAEVHFAPGGCWNEQSIGTNALALALDSRAPCEVFSAEHFSQALHDWVCYSAPIVEPQTGHVHGVIDLSTTWDRAHPLGLATATLLARHLSLLLPQRRAGGQQPGLELTVLGTSEVRLNGRALTLPPRQVELLTVLSLHPDGLTLDALHTALHPDLRVKPTTVKAEVSHLRRALGDGVIASRPYRLTTQVSADHLHLLDDLAAGRTGAALRRYRGELLPASQAPAVREHARYLEAALRRSVLTTRDPELLFALGEQLPDDLEVHEHTVDTMRADDPRRAIAAARIAASLD